MANDHRSIALRAVTFYRPQTETDKLKLTLANSSLLSDFCDQNVMSVCLLLFKRKIMTKLRQKLQISHFDVIYVLHKYYNLYYWYYWYYDVEPSSCHYNLHAEQSLHLL